MNQEAAYQKTVLVEDERKLTFRTKLRITAPTIVTVNKTAARFQLMRIKITKIQIKTTLRNNVEPSIVTKFIKAVSRPPANSCTKSRMVLSNASVYALKNLFSQPGKEK
jgi:hypothetical protein